MSNVGIGGTPQKGVRLPGYRSTKEYEMAYASIRRYDGVSDVDEVIRRVEEGFVPILSGTPGFIAYYAIDQGDGTGEVAVTVAGNIEKRFHPPTLPSPR